MRSLPKPLALIGAFALLFATGADAQRAPDCGFYTNSYGQSVPRPCGDARRQPPPRDASAVCRDGSYSFSRHHSGTCSGHGGVRGWLR
jgi:hypothetical protein